jgi:glycosyltransferase involved in cell wall biosynthesis
VYVTMLVHNTIGRGTFDRAHSLGRHLVGLGHQITLFAGASSRATGRTRTINGVKVVEAFDPLPARARESGLSPFDMIGRIRHLHSANCDLIHCFDHRPAVSIPGLWATRRQKIPVIFDWADLWGDQGIAAERRWLARISLGSVDDFLEKSVRSNVDGLTVINTALLDRAKKMFSSPVHLLPVGASSDLIKPLSKSETRRRFGLPLDAEIAVHTGLAPYDISYLAEAFVQVARKHPKALLVTTGRRFSAIERILGDAGFSERLIWLGMLDREQMTGAMACADVLLLPYTNRPVNQFRYPNKLGDYLSAGRPIVTNRTGDLGELIMRERAGLAVEDTTEAFAAAVMQLLGDADLASEIGRRGRELAETKLDWRFLAGGLEGFYHQVVSTRS